MGSLQLKLHENKNKIKREKFLAAVDPEFSAFLSNAEFSSDPSCIRFAAFPSWDKVANAQTTTRGKVNDWKNFSFKTWQELVSVLARFRKIKNYIGWFFIDIEGPYYQMSVNAFLANIKSISHYATAHEHFDLGWVGSVDDVGIIIKFNHISTVSNKFEVSIWGI
ncbi:MAG TPA: hypothetical protein DDY20_12265 [Desulfobulbaceae bacterium]|nr:hypothetical protein [Desulfobulbaceae bacterium]